jgi:hypothetical protein
MTFVQSRPKSTVEPGVNGRLVLIHLYVPTGGIRTTFIGASVVPFVD